MIEQRHEERMDCEAREKAAGVQHAMSEWFESALGKRLLEVERQLLEPVLSRRFGYHLLELGCARLNMHQSSPIGHKFSFSPVASPDCHKAAARADAIPLAQESVDLVLLHHALDYTENPHQLLREASRILIAGGHMVIVGFNPYSAWGLRKRLHWHKRVPWEGAMLSLLRVADWLTLLEFQVEFTRYGVYALPFNSPALIRYSSKLDNLAMRVNWPTGGIYVISARKQVLPLTPIQTSWKRFPTPVGIPVTENVSGYIIPGRRNRKSPCKKQIRKQ